MSGISGFLSRDKYRILLLCIVALVFLEPLVPDVKLSNYLFLVLISLILITGVYAVRGKGKHLVPAIVLLIPTLVVFWFQIPVDNEYYILFARTSPVLLFGYISVLIFADVMSARKVNSDVVAGGVSVYLLIGLIFSLLYHAHFILVPSAFSIAGHLDPPHGHGSNYLYIFNYFSYVTMTTLGYGDITPVSLEARTLVQIETLMGQLYVAIFIARLVSIQTANSMKKD
jgi:hypothetical protein